MAFWSGEKLLQNRNVIIPFSDGQVDCNAYTLRMGNCYYRTADRETDYINRRRVFSNSRRSICLFAYKGGSQHSSLCNGIYIDENSHEVPGLNQRFRDFM